MTSPIHLAQPKNTDSASGSPLNGTAERDWAMWAQEAISILERA